MPKYKLIYFNSIARGETARYMLALAGEDYEDFRINIKDWAEWKPKILKISPMGTLPILEIEGERPIIQSVVIYRYLARKLGFMGATDDEAIQIDTFYECLDDLLPPLMAIYAEKNEDKKKEMSKKYKEVTIQRMLQAIQTLWEQNDSEDFLVGNKVSLADVYFFAVVNDALSYFLPDFKLDGYPKFKALIDRLKSIPQMAKWLKERPVTEQ